MIYKKDLKQITYQRFGVILDYLTERVRNYAETKHISFDLIVPILRSGAFTGMHLASKLRITNILPAQYKYEYFPKEKTVKKFEFPKLLFKIPKGANILICDSNTVFGGLASRVITDVKTRYPDADLFFASANLDQSIKEFKDVKKVFYGTLSNEKRELSEEEAEKKGITNDVLIFPWEDLEEQWMEINASQEQDG